uniref:Uncharacterized protein n=1 Tax=Solanum lycopersicum TaxID=4081 RepID=A0A3Q7HA40_SOLLC
MKQVMRNSLKKMKKLMRKNLINDKFILSVGMTVTHICLVPCILRDRTRIRKKRNKKKYPRLASSYFSTVELHFLGGKLLEQTSPCGCFTIESCVINAICIGSIIRRKFEINTKAWGIVVKCYVRRKQHDSQSTSLAPTSESTQENPLPPTFPPQLLLTIAPINDWIPQDSILLTSIS